MFYVNFTKLTSEKKFINTIRVSYGLEPDQERRFVVSELGPNTGVQTYQQAPKESLFKYQILGYFLLI